MLKVSKSLSEAESITDDPIVQSPSEATSVTHDPVAQAYTRVQHVIPAVEWATMRDDVAAILQLKSERNAVILAHNYMTPEIFHGISDITGDSLELARKAVTVDADVIVLAGVHFMAETAKLLNPSKTVLIPDPLAGCSLAESITPEDVRALRAANPGVPVVTYVNTSAAVKAESDICCTSGNAEKIIASLGVERVIMIPDQYLAANIGKRSGVEVITHPGACEVHERFTPADIAQIRADHPGVSILAHPECPPPVVDAADYAGSTAEMLRFVADLSRLNAVADADIPGTNTVADTDFSHPGTVADADPSHTSTVADADLHHANTVAKAKVALITECSMSDNIAQLHPEIEFIRPCNLCPHMKRNTLGTIRRSLETMTHEVTIDPAVAERALSAVQRMLTVH